LQSWEGVRKKVRVEKSLNERIFYYFDEKSIWTKIVLFEIFHLLILKIIDFYYFKKKLIWAENNVYSNSFPRSDENSKLILFVVETNIF
jgi:hypothetical protein